MKSYKYEIRLQDKYLFRYFIFIVPVDLFLKYHNKPILKNISIWGGVNPDYVLLAIGNRVDHFLFHKKPSLKLILKHWTSAMGFEKSENLKYLVTQYFGNAFLDEHGDSIKNMLIEFIKNEVDDKK